MIKKILIANRAEIACRIIKTARKMGIATVAVYSEADKDALHVEMADEAVLIGPAPSVKSYLSVKNILNAIKETGADAVHPGYGFLSENPSFARTLKREGVIFIGPPTSAITSMGDKISSKKLAEKAGVNVIPGYSEPLKDARQAVAKARKVGYPVMLKASAGGGGKGMRLAWNSSQAKEGFLSAVNEAKASFGDGRVFVEKYIENPRHIEIQIIADAQGNTVYLGERECSIQRRHQKIIEESPSPFVDNELRKAMGEQAVTLAKAVKYVSAGTVEFVTDEDGNFYFLEMNTRLQVEHPVTELVTGLDLVELMIRIAAGEPLPFKQEDIRLNGWAMESRVYAEDPFREFLPSAGRLVRFAPPAESPRVRLDTGVYEGGEVSIHYDPMIAKLCTFGKNRNEALGHMRAALDSFYIDGVSHNIGFLAAVLAHPRFVEGRLSTNFIAEEYPGGFKPENVAHDDPAALIALGAYIHQAYQERAAKISGQTAGHARKVAADWTVLLKGDKTPVTVAKADGGYDVTVEGKAYEIRSDWALGDPLFHARIDGRPLCMQMERSGIAYRLRHSGAVADVIVLAPKAAKLYARMPEKPPRDTSNHLLSPMPGLLVTLGVKEGDKIKAGDPLAVVEAMKMENILRAPRDGKVKSLHAQPGQSLTLDALIMEFE